MAKAKVYNQQGKEIETIELNSNVFAVKVNPELVHEVVVAGYANKRQTLAHTKGRSDVRGGGRKPWKQKGTGRARHGSRRSPIWRGGGVTFGPTKERNFKKRINKKVKTSVIKMILTDRLAADGLVVVDTLKFDQPKTKLFAQMKKALPCGLKRVIIISDKKDEALLRITKNIDRVKTTFVGELGVVDLIESPYMIVSKEALKMLEKKYS